MRFLNDLAVVGMVAGLSIMIIGFFMYTANTLYSSIFTNGLGIVFISAIVYMGTER